MRLGTILKDWRYAKHLGTREASAMFGISDGVWRRIEAGKVPDGQTLITLWNYLVTPEATLNGTGPAAGQDASVRKELGGQADVASGQAGEN
jgi:hypothetical protein